MKRITTVLALSVLGLAACNAPETAEQPDASPTVSYTAAEAFTLTGTVTEVRDDDEAPDGLVFPTPGPSPTPTTSPAAADDPGSFDVVTASFSEELRDRCAIDPEEEVTVFWLDGTRFEPPSVLDDDEMEEDLDGRRVTIEGRIFVQDAVRAEATSDPERAGVNTAPPVTPAADENAEPGVPADAEAMNQTTNCVLVAEEVAVSEATSASPAATDGTGAGAATPTPDVDTEPEASPSATAIVATSSP